VLVSFSSDGRISCNETFKKHLEEFCKFTGRTLINIQEADMDEVFKNVEYDWSGVEFDRSSVVACNPKEVHVVKPAEYPNSEATECEITHIHSDASSEALELIKAESSSWNIRGGLSAEYHIGASAGIGYTKQKSATVKHAKGENVVFLNLEPLNIY
jgi:hypothetical protein